MKAEPSIFDASQFSVGSSMQNFGFYSIVLLMLLIILVQLDMFKQVSLRGFMPRVRLMRKQSGNAVRRIFFRDKPIIKNKKQHRAVVR
jgi:hypothetical protein